MCKKDYAYDALENKCTKCSGDIMYTVLAFLGVVLVLALVGAVVARKYPQLFEMVAKDAARGTVEQDEDGEDEDASHKWFRLVKSKLKIVLGVYLTAWKSCMVLGETNSPRRASRRILSVFLDMRPGSVVTVEWIFQGAFLDTRLEETSFE